MMKIPLAKIALILTLVIVIPAGILTGCKTGDEADFSIVLADTGEVVLSTEYIKSYDEDTHTIELNAKGIEQWNSYLTYTSIPKLADSLFGRDFIVKIDEEEIYRGKFYSGVSSASYSGVVILDALWELDDTRNTITIEYGYPPYSDGTGEDPRDDPAIIECFREHGLLK